MRLSTWQLAAAAAAAVTLTMATGGCSVLPPGDATTGYPGQPAAASTASSATTTTPPAPAAQPVTPPPPPAPVHETIAADPANASVVPVVDLFGEAPGLPRAAAPLGTGLAFEQHTDATDGADHDVAVDPTGTLLAFSSTRHSDRADIYLQRIDGRAVTQLTTDPADDVQPTFSPDGKRIAFASTRAGTWDLYLMDADGRNVELLVGTDAHEIHPSFSPDGTRIVYCALPARSGSAWELWVLDLATKQRKMIGHGLFPRWSPAKDHDRIVFQRARQRGSRLFGVWTIDLVDGEPRRLTEVAGTPRAAAVSPSFSPDGGRIAFATIPDPHRAGPGAAARARDIWVVNADGTSPQRLTDGKGWNLSPAWAPDGRVYFVSDRGGSDGVWSVRAPDAPSSPAAPATVDAKRGGSPKEGDTETPPTAVGSADGR